MTNQDSERWIDIAAVEAQLGRECGDPRTAPALRALVTAEFVAVRGDEERVAITWKGLSVVHANAEH
jgi:hypothetical protein